MNRDELLVKVNEAVRSRWHSERIDAVMSLLDEALSSQAEKNDRETERIISLARPEYNPKTGKTVSYRLPTFFVEDLKKLQAIKQDKVKEV